MKYRFDNSGVSLPMTIGLLLLLVTMTVTVNELVIRALRSSHQIEAADKAYLAAEAGMEDALYELSIHGAGYETPVLGNFEVRSANFDDNTVWKNEWEIQSRGINDCADFSAWAGFRPVLCGRIYEGGKLVISLYSDDAVSTGILTNEINETVPDIHTLNPSIFTLRFRVPPDIVADNLQAFDGIPSFKIDNDQDYTAANGRVNEDGQTDFGYPLNTCPYSAGVLVSDNDCDGREDEDSSQEPVVLWKLLDDAGHSFQPLRGCKSGSVVFPRHSSHPANDNAVLCEGSFTSFFNEISASINYSLDRGIDENGSILSLPAFVANVVAAGANDLQMEILAVAPFEAVDEINLKKVHIPYLEYGLDYTLATGEIPSTYFSIKSDGYSQDFKQSITTNVVPRTTTKLLDLTVIQQ